MPIEWIARLDAAPDAPGAPPFAPRLHADRAPPAAEAHLWPNRSLPRRGFAAVIGLCALMLALPIPEVLGTPALWVMLPFLLLVLMGLWLALRRNYGDGRLIERLRLWPDRIEITRFEPRGGTRDWHADPHWIRLTLHEAGGPVEQYLTLRGNGREVELGAFLAPEERQDLHAEIGTQIARLAGRR